MAELLFDIGNLTAVDVRKDSKKRSLKSSSRDSVQRLIDEIFSCPSVPSNDGPGRIAELPACITQLPREKPVPTPKPLTKWQMFAQSRGIQKKKKDKIAYDEMSGEWRRTYGYKRANNEMDEWAIEHKEGTDPSVDPFMKMSADKKLRIKQNRENHQKNLTAARGERIPGTIDLSSAISASNKQQKVGRNQNRANLKNSQNRSQHLEATLRVAQTSTASMGKFDKRTNDEPKPPAPPQKQQRDVVRDMALEKGRNLSILKQIVGKAPKETDLFDSAKAVNRLQVDNESSGVSERPRKERISKKAPKRGKHAQKMSNQRKKRRKK